MSNIALQIERVATGNVGVLGNVIFDTTVYSAGNISYNDATGVITFNEAGRYLINWWVSTQSSGSPSGVAFALSSSEGELLEGASPLKTGEVVGTGIINVSSGSVTVSLVNASPGSHAYALQTPLKAALTVVQVNIPTEPAETMSCFAVKQLTNILSQMITAYSTTTWTVYSESLASYSGVPLDLYTSPDATGPGILRLVDVNGDYEALPIANITAIYPGDGTLYDPSFSYLNPPDPLPPGCDTDMLAAIESYLMPVGTSVMLNLGPSISASGSVYQNKFGILVLSDASGNTPVFIPTPKILRIFKTGTSGLSENNNNEKKPQISIIKE